jgi:putative pyoverdin transport system ATP-binding/permease protein
MKIIAFFFEHSRKAILLSGSAGVVSGIANAALLAMINIAVKPGKPLLWVVWTFGGLCVLLPLARFISELLLTKLGQEATYSLRTKMCTQILAVPLQHLETLGPARILTTLTDDIPTITGALSVLPVICINIALVVGSLVYMATLSWLLFSIVMGFLILGIAGYQIPIIRVEKIFVKARQSADALMRHLRALTSGTKELKIHSVRRQAFVRHNLEASAESLMKHNISALRLYSAASSWGQTLVFVVIGLYLFSPSTRRPDNGTLIGYTLALLYLMGPLQVIMNSLPQLSRASIALRTIKEMGLALRSHEPEMLLEMETARQSWQLLELKSITHTYKRENESASFLLGPVDITFEPGKLVFITGGNGSGKTTLIKMLSGLYMPEQGHILLDGERIGPANIEWYRQHFSIVFADYFLFEELLGIDDINVDDRAKEYLEKLRLSHKVTVANGVLSTTNLSQGQRKRLALLTAYMEDRPIYIFDEWAADQDPYFKSVFYLQLLPELKARNKTVFVISHDDRYYHLADRLLRLEEGQIVSNTAGSTAPAAMAEPSLFKA